MSPETERNAITAELDNVRSGIAHLEAKMAEAEEAPAVTDHEKRAEIRAEKAELRRQLNNLRERQANLIARWHVCDALSRVLNFLSDPRRSP